MTAPSPQLSSPPRPALRTETITDYERFLALETDWNRLVDAAAPALLPMKTFHCPEGFAVVPTDIPVLLPV